MQQRIALPGSASPQELTGILQQADLAVRSLREAELSARAAQAIYVTAQHLNGAGAFGLALQWLDQHPLPGEVMSTPQASDEAYARGAALLMLSDRLLLDAAYWLETADALAKHLAMTPTERIDWLSLRGTVEGRLGREEDAIRTFEEIEDVEDELSECQPAELRHNRGNLRLELLMHGVWLGNPLADLLVAIERYSKVSTRPCLNPQQRAALYADAALAACILEEPRAQWVTAAREALKSAPSAPPDPLLDKTLEDADACHLTLRAPAAAAIRRSRP